MDQKTTQVKDFFHSYAGGFDSIYGHNEGRSAFGKWVDKTFRQTMFLRFEETLKNTANPEIKKVLDVGCGPGRYVVEFLLQGKEVTALDIASGMVDLAKKQVAQVEHSGKVNWVVADYMEHNFTEKHDAAVLNGFFDYIEHPEPLFEKLKGDITKEIYASFPHDTGLMAMQRKFRYKLRNCPMWYYTLDRIEGMLKNVGLTNYEVVDFKRDYFVKIKL